MIDRRAALRQLSLGALGAMAGSCSINVPAPRLPPAEPRRFARVRVSWDRVIRTVVGLRPFRPSGFVVRADRFDDRLVVHDYGHGGGGVTLSWGTARLAVERALEHEDAAIAVIGCGAVGLATARLLQQRGRQVTIYTRDLPPDTTSNVAGAQWSPFSVFDAEAATPAFRAQFSQAARLAYRQFQDLAGPRYGVRWIENYFISDEPIRMAPFFDELRELFPAREDLPPDAHPFGTRYAHRVTTMFIEPHTYLRALMDDVLLAGARIVVREFRDHAELLSLNERIIMNCTGIGARDLFGDTELTPVKGQLIVILPQPEVDYIVVTSGLYMFPRSDGILLGGTFERDVWTLEPNPDETRRIVEGHMRLFGTE